MTKPIQRHRLKPGPKTKVNIAEALPVLAESKSIKQAARTIGVHHRTLQNALERVEYKLAEAKPIAEFICPRCDQSGIKHKHRTICTDCTRKESTAAYRTGTRSIDPVAGWDSGKSTDWLSKPLMGAQS